MQARGVGVLPSVDVGRRSELNDEVVIDVLVINLSEEPAPFKRGMPLGEALKVGDLPPQEVTKGRGGAFPWQSWGGENKSKENKQKARWVWDQPDGPTMGQDRFITSRSGKKGPGTLDGLGAGQKFGRERSCSQKYSLGHVTSA